MSITDAVNILYGPRNIKTYEVVIDIDGTPKLGRQTMTAREVSELIHDIDQWCLPPGMVFVNGVAVKRFGKALK